MKFGATPHSGKTSKTVAMYRRGYRPLPWTSGRRALSRGCLADLSSSRLWPRCCSGWQAVIAGCRDGIFARPTYHSRASRRRPISWWSTGSTHSVATLPASLCPSKLATAGSHAPPRTRSPLILCDRHSRRRLRRQSCCAAPHLTFSAVRVELIQLGVKRNRFRYNATRSPFGKNVYRPWSRVAAACCGSVGSSSRRAPPGDAAPAVRRMSPPGPVRRDGPGDEI
ncbi:hypothetical protein LAUMK13_00423 [Mycobacterium innocens]|uniref:Uncharacterized protein n=1 Tax=Mycobacterium innocens TaxID=2341083 RepID=A0A498PT30_9MYCO|nr:hypothetical protein LAUMK13_00423 [Mycobacterium innocens]